VADWVSGAADMTVADGDFFGTGRTLSGEPTVLVAHSWEVHERSAAAAISA
jgi:hypothetical protein